MITSGSDVITFAVAISILLQHATMIHCMCCSNGNMHTRLVCSSLSSSVQSLLLGSLLGFPGNVLIVSQLFCRQVLELSVQMQTC